MGRFKTKEERLKKAQDKDSGKQSIFKLNPYKKGFRSKLRKIDLDKMVQAAGTQRIRQKV